MRMPWIPKLALFLPPIVLPVFVLPLIVLLIGVESALADGNIGKVNHVIVVMQENHSFDNYFGALAYAPGSPYRNGNGACSKADHSCVNGLSCTVDLAGI
jgi:phospholipase C